MSSTNSCYELYFISRYRHRRRINEKDVFFILIVHVMGYTGSASIIAMYWFTFLLRKHINRTRKSQHDTESICVILNCD